MPRPRREAPPSLPAGFVGGPRDDHFGVPFNAHCRAASSRNAATDAAFLRDLPRVPRALRLPPPAPWAPGAAAAAAAAAEAALQLPPRRPRPAPPRPPPPPPPPPPALPAAEFLLLLDAGSACARAWAEIEGGAAEFLSALRSFAPAGATARVVLFDHEQRTVYAGPANAARLPPRCADGLLRGPSAPLDALAIALRGVKRVPRVVVLLSGAPRPARARA
jgi:hypothetical protein